MISKYPSSTPRTGRETGIPNAREETRNGKVEGELLRSTAPLHHGHRESEWRGKRRAEDRAEAQSTLSGRRSTPALHHAPNRVRLEGSLLPYRGRSRCTVAARNLVVCSCEIASRTRNDFGKDLGRKAEDVRTRGPCVRDAMDQVIGGGMIFPPSREPICTVHLVL